MIWKTATVVARSDKKGLRYLPFSFTEQGVAMLSSVLKSEIAISVNIRITRVFSQMCKLMVTHEEMLLKLDKIGRKNIEQDNKIQLIFEYLKQLKQSKQEELKFKDRKRIGFKRNNET